MKLVFEGNYMDELTGKTISSYKIKEKLGQGVLGMVFKAKDTKLKRYVALKILFPQFTGDKYATQRFIHEAQIVSALDHQNICSIHEINRSENGRLFISMCYYDGQTLKSKIDKCQLTIKESIDLTIQIGQGLANAHETGIIHRDIKPANIIITADNVVKILDFGLANLSDCTQLTQEGSTIRTVAYTSPEQAQGNAVDHRSDIWSLGVLFYEMLTGKQPFRGDIDPAVIFSILNEDQEPLSYLNPDIPSSIEKTVAICLEKEPAKRYQQLTELVEELQSIRTLMDREESYKK